MPRFQWHNNWKDHKNNLHEILSNCKTFEEKKEKLNLYKDEQLFNIDVMHLLYPHMSFSDFAEQLTRLAELILSTALKLCYEHMKPNQKIPYALCALGKFGGEELGYASDLELIFIYANEGREDASHNPFFNTLIKTLIHCINAKSHGIFELDFRLRPYGEKGTLSTSLAHWVSYLKDPEKSLPYGCFIISS
jgi:glutamate-ammonia-ligase adenylyltransferase